jgi:hypothetical protein
MSNAVTSGYPNRYSVACAVVSDLLFGVGFGLLAIASTMYPAPLLSMAHPLGFVGLGFVIGGGLCRIIAGDKLPPVGGGHR